MATQFMNAQTTDCLSGSSEDADSPNSSAEVSTDQAFLVYKFLNTPSSMLVQGMTAMQPIQLSQFYRKLAIQLHPDKNRHPQATDAF